MFYNLERSHQSLGYDTPDLAYCIANGGGARIVDKYSATEEKTHSEIETKNQGGTVHLYVEGCPPKFDALFF